VEIFKTAMHKFGGANSTKIFEASKYNFNGEVN